MAYYIRHLIGWFYALGGPFLNILEICFLMRMLASWAPEVNESKMPWLIAYIPTEIVCKPTRKVLPKLFEVDSSPIFWLFFLSLVNELVFGGKEVWLSHHSAFPCQRTPYPRSTVGSAPKRGMMVGCEVPYLANPSPRNP